MGRSVACETVLEAAPEIFEAADEEALEESAVDDAAALLLLDLTKDDTPVNLSVEGAAVEAADDAPVVAAAVV